MRAAVERITNNFFSSFVCFFSFISSKQAAAAAEENFFKHFFSTPFFFDGNWCVVWDGKAQESDTQQRMEKERWRNGKKEKCWWWARWAHSEHTTVNTVDCFVDDDEMRKRKKNKNGNRTSKKRRKEKTDNCDDFMISSSHNCFMFISSNLLFYFFFPFVMTDYLITFFYSYNDINAIKSHREQFQSFSMIFHLFISSRFLMFAWFLSYFSDLDLTRMKNFSSHYFNSIYEVELKSFLRNFSISDISSRFSTIRSVRISIDILIF